MKKIRFLLAGLMAAGVLTLAGCGGGGGGGNDGNNPVPVAALSFNMIELAGFGGDFSAGVAINDSGLAVGFSHNGTSIRGAKWLVTNPSQPTLLAAVAGNNYSAAYGVNAAGIVVGESGVTVSTTPDANTVAVFWPAGSSIPVELSTAGLFSGGASAAFGINSDGKIVGEAVNGDAGNTVAVYWASTSSAPVKLNNLPGGDFSSAYFIGADGRIVGESRNSSGQAQAVVWRPALIAGYENPLALEALPNQTSSVALGVDSTGRIVGEVELAGGVVQGVIWSATGSITSNFGANTSLQAINDLDRIIGYSAATFGSDRATLWNGKNIGDTINFSSSFTQAYGLNANNQVVGTTGTSAFAASPQ